MPSLGILSVTFAANTNKFHRRVKGARRELDAFSASVGFTKRALGTLTAGFVGIAGIRKFTGAIIGQFNEIDRITKVADRLGLTVEQMQSLSQAAKLSGVEVKQLETGLQRMIRRVSQAADGTGEAVDALYELGLSARRLERQSPVKTFGEIADRLNRLGSNYDRVRIAQKLFDSEGVALLQTMKMGSKGFENLQDKLRKSGVLFSRDMADGIVKANDAMTDLMASSDAFFRQLAVTLLPVINKITKTLGEFTLAMRFPSVSLPAAAGGALRGIENITSFGGRLPTTNSKFAGEMASQFEQKAIWEQNILLQKEMVSELKRLNVGAQ